MKEYNVYIDESGDDVIILHNGKQRIMKVCKNDLCITFQPLNPLYKAEIYKICDLEKEGIVIGGC